MQVWSNTLVGKARSRKKVTPREFFKQVVTPEDSTGTDAPLQLGLMASITKVTLCISVAFASYAMIAQLQ